MRRLALALLSLLLPALLLLPGSAASQAAEEGAISGTVVNGTAGGGSTAGLPVTLIIFGPGEPATRETLTDDAGAFAFEQVPISPETAYQLTAVYADIEYPGPVTSLASAEELADQELAVYETTSDPAAIRASLLHLVIETDEESRSLVVSELILVNNSGDRTYVGAADDDAQERPETLRFNVPPDALEVGIIDGLLLEDLATTDFGFTDTSPWVPGTRQVSFTYSLPYQGTDYVFRTSLDFPVDTASILMLKGEASLESDSPFIQGETVLEGQSYLRARADNLEAGAPIQAILTGLPRSSSGSNVQGAVFAALAAAALGVVAVAVYTIYRRSRLVAVTVEEPNEREKADLLFTIAELDRQHEAGEMADREYNRRRAQAKKRLEAIW